MKTKRQRERDIYIYIEMEFLVFYPSKLNHSYLGFEPKTRIQKIFRPLKISRKPQKVTQIISLLRVSLKGSIQVLFWRMLPQIIIAIPNIETLNSTV